MGIYFLWAVIPWSDTISTLTLSLSPFRCKSSKNCCSFLPTSIRPCRTSNDSGPRECPMLSMCSPYACEHTNKHQWTRNCLSQNNWPSALNRVGSSSSSSKTRLTQLTHLPPPPSAPRASQKLAKYKRGPKCGNGHQKGCPQ